ncbi:MAG: GntR family transcriptional regulator [Microbacteriaceae bacterium]|nr:GntR family transcriptional regulator [Microbacteriaceae bacterium]
MTNQETRDDAVVFELLKNRWRSEELGREAAFRAAQRGRAAEEIPVSKSSQRAYGLIRAGIRLGIYPVDSRLHESSLVHELTISRTAVRQALNLLADEGLVARRQRVGTVVIRRPLENPSDWTSESSGPADRRERLGRERIFEELVPAGAISDLIMVPSGIVKVACDRILWDGTVIGVRAVYKDADATHASVPRTAMDVGTAFAFTFDVALGHIESQLETLACDERLAKLLGMNEGAPILYRELLLHDVDGRPLMLSCTHYRGDRVAVSTERMFPEHQAAS